VLAAWKPYLLRVNAVRNGIVNLHNVTYEQMLVGAFVEVMSDSFSLSYKDTKSKEVASIYL
jgi:hypothetical protein